MYIGEFSMGRKEGYGKIEFENGEYSGTWFNNRMHGQGKQILKDGCKYYG